MVYIPHVYVPLPNVLYFLLKMLLFVIYEFAILWVCHGSLLKLCSTDVMPFQLYN